jgi:hypothetical protein
VKPSYIPGLCGDEQRLRLIFILDRLFGAQAQHLLLAAAVAIDGNSLTQGEASL